MPLILQSLFRRRQVSLCMPQRQPPRPVCDLQSAAEFPLDFAGNRRANREDQNMSSPVVLITGALTGIGRATAAAFAKDGAHIVVSGLHEPEGKPLAAEVLST